jgi:hypothetical protein
VNKHGFEVPGTVFEAMFALPPGNDNQIRPEGTSLDSPIFLEGIGEDQFRAFLLVLYPLWVSSTDNLLPPQILT